MTDRDKIIETMTDEKRSRCAECGAWGPVREYHPFAYCQLVKAIGEKAARANIDAVVEYGRKLERSHLQASGMAVVPGWQSIESAPKDGRRILLCGPDNDGSTYMDACRWPKNWSGKWPVAYMAYAAGEPTHWRPLPEPPASPSFNPVAQEKKDE